MLTSVPSLVQQDIFEEQLQYEDLRDRALRWNVLNSPEMVSHLMYSTETKENAELLYIINKFDMKLELSPSLGIPTQVSLLYGEMGD